MSRLKTLIRRSDLCKYRRLPFFALTTGADPLVFLSLVSLLRVKTHEMQMSETDTTLVTVAFNSTQQEP